MQLSQKQKKQIDEIGQKYNLKLILLHGSYATDKQRHGSDLDIAVLGYKPVSFDNFLKLFGEFGGIFGDNHDREIDVKSLHKTDPLFQYQVAKDNQLLYGSLSNYSDFRAHAFARYLDSSGLRQLESHLIDKYQHYLNNKYALA